MEWFRCYHGISSDPKWALIARKSGQPKAVVLAVWLYALDFASQAEDRGSIASIDPELVDVLYDLEDGSAASVLDAMQAKGLVTDDRRLAAWDKRQPAREDAQGPEAKPVAQRVRECRERKKLREAEEAKRGVTQGNAEPCDVTPCNADVTDCNAESRDVTQGNAPDTDTDIDTEKTHTPLPPSRYSVTPPPMSQEDVEEAKDDVRRDRQKGDYEFSLLRQEYDAVRQEGELSGRQEFLELYHSRDWPGLDEILAGLQALVEQDDPFRRGFGPGLGKFIAQRMWRMKPRLPSGSGTKASLTAQQREELEEKKRRIRAERKAKEAENRRIAAENARLGVF